jgi:single-stranded DNA-binding protein
VEPISVTVTGHLARDPREFSTDRGPGVSLWLEVPLGRADREYSRYMKVVAWGTLAANVSASLHKNDRVTVRASDIRAELWTDDDQARTPHTCLAVTAWDISPSLLRDTAVMGSTARRAAARQAADGEPNNLPAAAQADLKVLAGVTADTA